jgi:NAD(P)H-hydrate epimerase
MYNPDPQLYTAAQMRALEARVMQSTEQGGMGVSGYTLMQRAGQCAFEVLLHRWPSAKGITVVCGKGNNAGDGYVVARMAQQFGLRVQLLAAANPSELAGDARVGAPSLRRGWWRG